MWKICLCGILSVVAFGLCPAADQKKVKQVEEGKITEAKASWWGFDGNDSTACLQSAIDSGVKKLVIDHVGGDWIVGPIRLRSNLELVLEDGVVVRAKKGLFYGTSDCLFALPEIRNVVIRGEGRAVLRMNKSDYLNPALKYPFSEWRHMISLRGCSNIRVSNLTLESSGGDGIYVGTGWTKGSQRYCKDVVIDKITASDHYRQGISIISCENLLIKDSVFNHTKGTEPQCGIDFEPNFPHEVLINCVVENCEFNDNNASGILFYLLPFNQTTKPVSVTLRNVKVKGNSRFALQMQMIRPHYGKQYDGFIKFENCEFDGSVEVLNQRDDGLKLIFKNCLIRADKNVIAKLLSFYSECPASSLVELDHVTLEGEKTADHPPFAYDATGHRPKFTGNVFCNGKMYDLTRWSEEKQDDPMALPPAFAPAKLNVNDFTEKPAKTTTVEKGRFQLRNRFKFLQFANQGEEITIRLKNNTVGTRKLGQGTITVTAPNGGKWAEYKLDTRRGEFKFTAPATGIYQLDGNTAGNVLILNSSHPGQGFSTESFRFLNSRGRLYFEVPGDLTELDMKIGGEPREPVTIHLYNAQNEKVAELNGIETCRNLRYTRKSSAKNEIWSLDVIKMREDGSIQFGREMLPLIGLDPNTLLRKK